MLAWHVAGLLPWGPLLAGCLAGIGVAAALRIFAGPIETPVDLGAGIRASFVPVVAGLAFVMHDPYRQLTGALPAWPWLTPAIRVGLALPVLALSCLIQLQVAARALAADLHTVNHGLASHGVAGLPWVAFTAEFAAWCALAIALAASLDRTRWRDQSGFAAAALALAMVGGLALLPVHLLPAAITAMTSAQRQHWTDAWRLWVTCGVAAAMIASWAAGDPWRRLRWPRLRVAAAGISPPAPE